MSEHWQILPPGTTDRMTRSQLLALTGVTVAAALGLTVILARIVGAE